MAQNDLLRALSEGMGLVKTFVEEVTDLVEDAMDDVDLKEGLEKYWPFSSGIPKSGLWSEDPGEESEEATFLAEFLAEYMIDHETEIYSLAGQLGVQTELIQYVADGRVIPTNAQLLAAAAILSVNEKHLLEAAQKTRKSWKGTMSTTRHWDFEVKGEETSFWLTIASTLKPEPDPTSLTENLLIAGDPFVPEDKSIPEIAMKDRDVDKDFPGVDQQTRDTLRTAATLIDELEFNPSGDRYDYLLGVDQKADGEFRRPYIQLRHWRPDSETGVYAWGYSGKRYLSPHMTDGEIMRQLFAMTLGYQEHEVREHFRWQGRAIFGPHIDIHELWRVADQLDTRSED